MINSIIGRTLAFAACIAFSTATAFAAPPAAPAAPAQPAAAAAPAAKAPSAVILFLDRAAVLRTSAVGKDMETQVEAMIKKMETDFSPQTKQLQADAQALQTSQEAMDAKQAKARALEARRDALKKSVEDRQAQIQGGLAQARQKVEAALGPILSKLLTERGANLLLDRGLVVLGQNDLDITTAVIGRLNAALPKVAVTLTVAPATVAAVQPKPAAPAH